MICRGGIVVGGWGDVPAAARDADDSGCVFCAIRVAWWRRWAGAILGVVVVAAMLVFLPYRSHIPPVVESDYCYQLIAADRFHDGQGLTAPQPVAPLQPWEWRADWVFLTKWPVGYPVLVAGIRFLTGGTSLEACSLLSTVACAAALVGWFVWIRRVVPCGAAGCVLAAVGAGCALSTGMLLNPSSDLLLVAALPWVLLAAAGAMRAGAARGGGEHAGPARLRACRFLPVGLAAGGLFWIRYAGVFVPVAIGAYLVVVWFRHRRVTWRALAAFAVGGLVPMATLLLVNQAFGPDESAQAQMNLGHSVGFDLSIRKMTEAWWRLTDLGFYDHHAWTHWVYALWPIALVGAAVCVPAFRRGVVRFGGNPAVGLSAATLASLLGMLLTATTLFGDKFDYVGLDRYYAPVRPLYFVLFAAPVLMIPRRLLRAAACLACLLACSWIVRQEWARSYERRLADTTPRTPYGVAAACFGPHAGELYRWLGMQQARELTVVSNFHEWIALETKLPALPIPPDPKTLEDWVARIRVSRGVTDPHVLFVLSPDNGYRDYWIADPADVKRAFRLEPVEGVPPALASLVFQPAG